MWKYFFILLWICWIIAGGIHLFSRGFLLSRIATTNFNTCIRLSLCEENDANCLNRQKADELMRNVNDSIKYCLPQKSKIILILIDALKYDFGVFNQESIEPKPYENKLPIMHQLLEKYPKNTRISRFIADPPTTTLQRLKGLTTGSLPTFIDVGSNFDTPEINEDNIIDQVLRNNLSAIFMGDSTWTELFPNRFKRQYSYPSFNIYDLDTVDTEIKKYLPKELRSNDWDLLIAHFLGVDHCGHKYGPMHREMSRKLNEMNEAIGKVANDMDDETTLFVIGDHGMTGTGDHGGDTRDETDALIFAYSKKQEFFDDDLQSLTEIRQIDLVPTLSVILGVPIPYSNLGSINFNFIPNVLTNPLNMGQQFLLHLWNNALQMRQYFTNYINLSTNLFSEDIIDDQFRKFTIYSYRATTLYTDTAMANFHKDLKLYLKEILELCRNIWINFDVVQMSQGLVIVATGIVLSYPIFGDVRVGYFMQMFSWTKIGIIYSGNVIMALIGVLFSTEIGFKTKEHAIILLTSIFNIISLIIVLVLCRNFITENLNRSEKGFQLVHRLLFVYSISIFFSNSFIIEEQKILCYILIGLILLHLGNIERIRLDQKCKIKFFTLLTSKWIKIMLLTMMSIFVIRMSYIFYVCREEQGNCSDFNSTSRNFESHNSESYSSGHNKQKADIVPVIVLAFFVTLIKMFLRSSGNQSGFAPNVLMVKFSVIITALAVGGHFVLSQTPRHGVKQINIDMLAWVAYFSLGLHILVILFDPLMLYVLRKSGPEHYFHSDRIIPSVFNYLKNELRNKQLDDGPYVSGITAAYSSALISFSVTLTLVLAILLGPNASMGFFIAMIAAIAVLCLGAISRYQSARRLENCLQPLNLTLIAWHILIQFSFYATSHQPTLSQIDWHAAFVGRSSVFNHSNYISVIMILLNTFAGPIFLCFLYPMLILIGPSIHSLLPSLITKQTEIHRRQIDAIGLPIIQQDYDFSVIRGELELFDNEVLFIGTLFKVGCQLLILQSLRVFCSMFACTIHARHLMVWKIFAPKFMYEGISTYLCFIAILAGFALILRTHTALSRLIAKIV